MKTTLLIIIGCSLLGAAGCATRSEGPAERIGRSMDEIADEVEDLGDDLGERRRNRRIERGRFYDDDPYWDDDRGYD